MSYIGNTPTTQNFVSGTDYFNGTGAQTAFTLSRTVNSVNDIQVTVNNVVQQPNDAYTLSGTTLTMTSAPSAGTNNVYVRYLSTTTQVITPSQNTVSWNTLDSNTQQDLGLMYKNKIINGNMAIDQRNAGASVTLTSGGIFTVDRFDGVEDTDGGMTAQQDTSAPAGFVNSLKFTTTTADGTLGATQWAACRQMVEGSNIYDLGWGTASAKTVTLSFWVRSSLTGTFGGALSNSAFNRSYPFTYSISVADTWEYKTITIVGDTSGTWLTTTGIGIRVQFGLGVGATYSGTAGAWTGSGLISATGATSVIGTLNATWFITGVQLEVGTQATAFSTAGGSYGAELALCQRYFYKISGATQYLRVGTGPANTTTNSDQTMFMQVAMRATPTSVTTTGSFGLWSGGTIFSVSAFTLNSNGCSPYTASVGCTSTGLTADRTFQLIGNNDSTASLAFSAEL